jgi:hypothetical protein
LIPSVTRVFSTDHELHVYLQAYKPHSAETAASAPAPAASTNSAAPLIAFVSFYKDQKKAFETSAIAATAQPESRLGIVPLSFDINLGTLAPGEYECQVNVFDPVEHKVSFWRGAFKLVK